MDHRRRIELARQVTEFVLHRHPEVIAVAVHGSTTTSEHREHSDLEMFAVTRGRTDTQGYGTIHEGIVVEIELVARGGVPSLLGEETSTFLAGRERHEDALNRWRTST